MSKKVDDICQKAILGILCGGVLTKVGGEFVCLNDRCEKHKDLPIEQQTTFNNFLNSNYSVAASGTSISYTSPRFTTDTTLETII